MAALAILGQKQIEGLSKRQYVVSNVLHDGLTNTVSVDQSAQSVTVTALDGQTAPTATLGTASSTTFLKDVTLTGGGTGRVDVWTYHGIAVGSSKA